MISYSYHRSAKIRYEIIFCIIALSLTACTIEENVNQIKVGDLAPSYIASDFDGKMIASEMNQGKVQLLEFWSISCIACVQSIPFLNELQKEFKDKGFTVIALSLDKNPDHVKNFSNNNGIQYPILMGDNAIARAYNVLGYPMLFLVNQQGVISHIQLGVDPTTKEQIRQKIVDLVNMKKENKDSK